MKTLSKVTFILAFLFSFTSAHSQTVIVSAGGTTTVSGKTVSYSIGQVFNTASSGIQQPYEIFEVIGVNEIDSDVIFSVFPNPTTNVLFLDVSDFKDISYQLIDLQGKTLNASNVVDTKTEIQVSHLPTGMYILNVFQTNKSIKSYKIIKR